MSLTPHTTPQAVELGKHCELVVMPKAKWGAARDRPFPENVFNPEWEPFCPELKPAFAAIATAWEEDYQPACLLKLLQRLAPCVSTPLALDKVQACART